MKYQLLAIVTIISLSFVTQAYALRCGTMQVVKRDTIRNVLYKCGSPERVKQAQKKVVDAYYLQDGFSRLLHRPVNVEYWIYDRRHYGDFVYQVTLVNGSVVNVSAILPPPR